MYEAVGDPVVLKYRKCLKCGHEPKSQPTYCSKCGYPYKAIYSKEEKESLQKIKMV